MPDQLEVTLGIDIGTGSTKAGLVDGCGRLVAVGRSPIGRTSLDPVGERPTRTAGSSGHQGRRSGVGRRPGTGRGRRCRALRPDARGGGLRPRRPTAPTGRPLVGPSIGTRPRPAGRPSRPRGPHRSGQPGGGWHGRPQPGCPPPTRTRPGRTDPDGPATEGLAPGPPDRCRGHRSIRCLGHAPVGRRARWLVATGPRRLRGRRRLAASGAGRRGGGGPPDRGGGSGPRAGPRGSRWRPGRPTPPPPCSAPASLRARPSSPPGPGAAGSPPGRARDRSDPADPPLPRCRGWLVRHGRHPERRHRHRLGHRSARRRPGGDRGGHGPAPAPDGRCRSGRGRTR